MPAQAANRQQVISPDTPAQCAALPLDHAVQALRDHPDLDQAMRSAAAGMLETYTHNALLNRVLNDRGRAIGAFVALYLHAERVVEGGSGGLTVGRFQMFCVEVRLCSAGRARALLTLMRLAGYLTPGPRAPDRRQRRLQPTERLIDLHRQRWQRQFIAMAPVMPRARKALGRLEHPSFLLEFMRQLGRSYRAGFRILPYVPELAGVVESNAGLLVALDLFVRVTEPVPPDGTVVPVSMSALSARFGIARAHARGLLAQMTERGLVTRGAMSESVIVLPRLTTVVSRFFAAAFALLGHCAEAAIEAAADAL